MIARFRCENCWTAYQEVEELINPISDLDERLLPGDTMPYGACPVCDALVQRIEPHGAEDPED